jgi:hypothetical protein
VAVKAGRGIGPARAIEARPASVVSVAIVRELGIEGERAIGPELGTELAPPIAAALASAPAVTVLGVLTARAPAIAAAVATMPFKAWAAEPPRNAISTAAGPATNRWQRTAVAGWALVLAPAAPAGAARDSLAAAAQGRAAGSRAVVARVAVVAVAAVAAGVEEGAP